MGRYRSPNQPKVHKKMNSKSKPQSKQDSDIYFDGSIRQILSVDGQLVGELPALAQHR